MLKLHEEDQAIHQRLSDIFAEPSLYDEALRLGVASRVSRCQQQAWSGILQNRIGPITAVIAAWKQIYQAPEAHWPLYELAEKLVDLEDYFRRWRFNHVTTVERIIGMKRGTGGTEGRRLSETHVGDRALSRPLASEDRTLVDADTEP